MLKKEECRKELSNLNATMMFCECCENKFKRWDIDIVEPEDVVFEINKVLKDRGHSVEFNFACPECVTDLALEPVQSEHAKKFRERNEKLRKELAPQIIH
jgi:hypothetical protein